MSAPASRSSRFPVTLASHAWWILLLVALLMLAVATERRIRRVNALTNLPTWSVDAPTRDAASPTGFAQGQRRLIVPGHHSASFWWIMETQQAAAQGKLRLRHITYDAPPAGRDIRRTAPYRWWLTAVGWLRGAVTGEPLGYTIERGALIADPLLLALLLVLGAAYSARYLGSFAAIGFVAGGILLFPLASNFQPGAPDPHSLGWVLALGSVLPLLAATKKVGTHRRTHFVVAGIFGGLGFWNDATSQAPILLAICLGALGYEFLRSRGTGQPPVPANWRAWGLAGTLTTLAASVFEFAPNYFSWSLDAVSPIHAVAWWGMGETLRAAGIWCAQGRRVFDRRSLALLGVAVVALAAWPVTGWLRGTGALLASDFHAFELANHPAGANAPNLRAWLHSPAGDGAKWATLLPCALGFVLVGRIILGRIDREERGRLIFVFIAGIFAAVLACYQLRWWNLFDVFALVALTALFAGTETVGTPGRWWTRAAALLALPGLFVGFPAAVESVDVKQLAPLETQALIERDYAYFLARHSGAAPTVLFSTPIFSDAAAFYGGFSVALSSDAGSKTGYLTAVRFVSATSEAEAAILARAHAITDVALPLWDPALDQFVRIGLNLPADQPPPQDAFLVALRWWNFPLWMRPINYMIPDETGIQGYDLRTYAIQAEQEPDLALSRLTDLFVERGQVREAKALSDGLKAYPRSLSALGAIANISLASGDRPHVDEVLEKLIPFLSRRWARDLPADRRISLAALLVQTDHVDLARDQIRACLAGLNAETLRTLTMGSVVRLLALSRSFAIPFPDKALEVSAMELVPPSVRPRLERK